MKTVKSQREAAFWTIAELRNQSRHPGPDEIAVSLDMVDSGSGRLNADSSTYDSEGTAFTVNDVLYGKLRPYLQKYWHADRDGVAIGDIYVFGATDLSDPRFLFYVVAQPAFSKWGEITSTGVKMPRTNWASLRDYRITLPSLDTQRRIADYLDTETAQIDAMMAKLDEQVGLLWERRGAVLGRIMDQSEVPTTTIGKIAEVTLGKAKNSKAEAEGAMKFPYIRAANIQPGGVFFEEWKEMPFSKSELERYSLNEDDVLVVEGGAGFGRSLTLKQDLPETGFQNHVLRIRARKNYIGQFIDYTVRYHLASGLIELMSVGATIPGLSSEKARALPIAHISLDEQRRIVAELDEKTSRIDTMITKCEELKTLLQERRAALITATITGRRPVPDSFITGQEEVPNHD